MQDADANVDSKSGTNAVNALLPAFAMLGVVVASCALLLSLLQRYSYSPFTIFSVVLVNLLRL